MDLCGTVCYCGNAIWIVNSKVFRNVMSAIQSYTKRATNCHVLLAKHAKINSMALVYIAGSTHLINPRVQSAEISSKAIEFICLREIGAKCAHQNGS